MITIILPKYFSRSCYFWFHLDKQGTEGMFGFEETAPEIHSMGGKCSF